MNREHINKTRIKSLKRKKYFLRHELKVVRTMTNRRFRRKDRIRISLSTQPDKPSKKNTKLVVGSAGEQKNIVYD